MNDKIIEERIINLIENLSHDTLVSLRVILDALTYKPVSQDYSHNCGILHHNWY